MLSLNMETTIMEGLFCITIFWIVSKFYSMGYNYFKRKSSASKELYLAVCNGHLLKLRSILSTNVDVNMRIGRDRNTLLHHAPSAEITKELLLHGADVDAVNADGMTPLFFAIIDNKGLAVIQQLLEHGADVNLKTGDGHSALHFVPCLTEKNGLSVVKELIKHGINVNSTDHDNATPLFFAVMCETNLDIIKELLMNGADINIRGRYPFTTRYFTSLDLAVDEEKIHYAQLIVKIIALKHFDEDYRKIIDLDSYVGSFDYGELSKFLEKCNSELVRMKEFQINNNLTLFDFVSKTCDKENIKPLYAVNTITEEEITSNFPLYHDIFWPNMKLCLERAGLLIKLSELQVCVGSDSLIEEEYKEKEVILNHDCMYKIGEYLSNDDLLNFISGFEKVLNSFHIFRANLWN